MNDLHPSSLPAPPEWSLFVGDLGRWLVVATVVFFGLSVLAGIFGGRSTQLQSASRWGFSLGCAGLVGTFVCLATLFVANRFEYEYVWGHSDTKNAIIYRIAGIWSGQEGSFLLWGVCAAIFTWVCHLGAGIYQRWYVVVCSLFLAAIAGILAFESPFGLNMMAGQPVVPADGVGLAPSLQNYWVTIHPPTIFLGFGSLTVLFAMAVAAMLVRNYDGWVRIIRPWAIVSVTLIGVGLCMGGFWAYETLGWGGFWMWDPVENVSFVPWVFTAALVHGIIVQVTRNRWHASNLLMAGLPFLAFLYGTFLTRSGFLADASVHSFAEMDRSALKLLVGLMAGMTGGFTILWIVRFAQARKASAAETEKGFHREGFYRAGALLLINLGLATLIGMSVPLVKALQGLPPSVVEERVYHLVVPWLFIPLMLILAIAPLVGWRSLPGRELSRRLYTIFCLSVGLAGLFLLGIVMTPLRQVAKLDSTISFPAGIEVQGMPWILCLVGVCLFAIVGNVWRMVELSRASKLAFAPFLTHIGVAVTMAGLIISRGFERHEQTMVMEDHPAVALGYAFTYRGMTSTLDDRDNKVKLLVSDPRNGNREVMMVTPGLYQVTNVNGEVNPMVWPAIQRFPFHDLYVTLHPPQSDASEPFSLAPGERTSFGGFVVTFKRMVRKGEFGSAGTKFGAEVSVAGEQGSKTVTPLMELGGDKGVIQHPADIDGNLRLAMVGMDAAKGAVTLQMQLTSPMYPLEVFHKPMTGLVWLGTGIMTLGGLLAAVYRRVPRRATAPKGAEGERPQEKKRKLPVTA